MGRDFPKDSQRLKENIHIQLSKIREVFTKEYKEKVGYYEFTEKMFHALKLNNKLISFRINWCRETATFCSSFLYGL